MAKTTFLTVGSRIFLFWLLWVGASTALMAGSQTPPILTRIVDTTHPVPGGLPSEAFELLMEDPVLVSDRCIAFLAVGDMGSAGVDRLRRGNLERVADASTPVPDGQIGDVFTDIDTLALEGCDTLFVGIVNDAYAGIYLQPAEGSASVVTDFATPVPRS